MKTLHSLSGIFISLFIGLHLTNHFCSLIGPEQHIEVMTTLRLFYRNLFVEILLLGAVFIQIISGIKLFILIKRNAISKVDRLQSLTGLYMAFFLFIHVSAVLVGRSVLQLDTNFYFGAAGINTYPFNLFFIPYYALAIMAWFGHIACIHYKKMKHSVCNISPKNQSYIIFILGVFVTLFLLYGLTNHFQGYAIPKEYRFTF